MEPALASSMSERSVAFVGSPIEASQIEVRMELMGGWTISLRPGLWRQARNIDRTGRNDYLSIRYSEEGGSYGLCIQWS